MTDEQQYNYNRYLSLYEAAKGERDRAIACAENSVAQYKATQNDLSEYSTKKKSLEQRLEDIKEIISTLDNTVEQSISTANRSGAGVGETYCSAIHCSAISSASIQTAYHLQSVQEDLHSGRAYQDCLREKQRLESSIAELSAMIGQLNAKINELTNDIKRLENAANSLTEDMNFYANKVNSCL